MVRDVAFFKGNRIVLRGFGSGVFKGSFFHVVRFDF